MKIVLREECLQHFKMFEHSNCSILLIQAQAGQGKTTFAHQCQQETRRPATWISCTPKDQDPLVLYDKIVKAFFPDSETALKRFQHDIVKQSSLNEALALMKQKISDLAGLVCGSQLLLIDDLHLIQSSTESLKLLKHLIEGSTYRLKYILLTRHPLQINGQAMFSGSRFMQIDNSMLAFSRDETARLLNQVLNVHCSIEQMRTLYRKTQGWVTGLLLLASGARSGLEVAADRTAGLHEYFFNFIQQQQDLPLKAIIRLGLLDEVPLEFVQEVFPGLGHGLTAFASKKMFVHPPKEGQDKTIIFHDLFKKCLRDLAKVHLRQREVEETLNLTAEWLTARGRIPEALFYCVRCGKWTRISELLQTHGLELISRNRYRTLAELFEDIPDHNIFSDGWLSFFAGEVLFATAPQKCLSPLDRARQIFHSHKQDTWELLAIASILLYDITIDGNFGRKKNLVLRGDELFQRVDAQLDGATRVRIIHALAMGSIYILGDSQKARAYNQRALNVLAEKGDVHRFQFAFINLALEPLFSGRIDSGLTRLDTSFSLSSHHELSPTLQFTIELLYLFILTLKGTFSIYEDQKQRLLTACADISRASYLGTYTLLFDSEQLVFDGKFQKLLHVLSEGEDDPRIAGSPHILSQVLQYRAFALAVLERHDELWECVKRSLKLRTRAGSPHFRAKNKIILGAALSLGPRTDLAEKFLKVGITESKRVNESHARVTAYAYRAAMRLRKHDTPAALRDIERMLEQVSIFDKNNCFLWHKQTMAFVLSKAVQHAIYPQVARTLAREQMSLEVTEDGSSVPLLRISTIGPIRFTVPFHGKTFRLHDLRPKPQKLLTILLHSPSGMSAEAILDHLSEAEGTKVSRNNLDTILSRLRTDLSKAGELKGSDYVQLSEGVLRLTHTLCETQLIERHVQKGLQLARQDQHWRANLELATAFRLLQDSLNTLENTGNTAYIDLPHDLSCLVPQAALAWSGFLEHTGKPEDALSVIDLALHCDPINDQLQIKRYELLSALGRPAKAFKSLKTYQCLLEQEGFHDEEIKLILDTIL